MCALVVAAFVAAHAIVATGGVLPAGTHLQARMNTTVGTVKSVGVDRIAGATRRGAPFAATVAAPVVDERGTMRMPPGAIVHGHVAELRRGEGVRRPIIALDADTLDARPIRAHVVDPEVQQLPAVDTGRDVQATAVWGAIVGGLAFGVPGVVVGYGVGGASGAARGVSVRRTDGWLSAGSLVTIELDEPLRLRPRRPRRRRRDTDRAPRRRRRGRRRAAAPARG